MERHLQTRRPRKDRDVTWGRHHDRDRHTVMWTLWRRDSRRAIHCVDVTITEIHLEAVLWSVGYNLLVAKRKLRDSVDEIDLALMEQTA